MKLHLVLTDRDQASLIIFSSVCQPCSSPGSQLLTVEQFNRCQLWHYTWVLQLITYKQRNSSLQFNHTESCFLCLCSRQSSEPQIKIIYRSVLIMSCKIRVKQKKCFWNMIKIKGNKKEKKEKGCVYLHIWQCDVKKMEISCKLKTHSTSSH